MARVTPKGLQVWDLDTDQFDHTMLSGNWDLINDLLGAPASQVETLPALPTTGNFAGRVVMLSGSDGGFQPWTLVRYDGSSWRPVNQIEIQPTIPTSGNFAGRVVILSAASSGFPQWGIVRYDGSSWAIVGGWQTVNTGSGTANISGLQSSGDIYANSTTKGFVIKDRLNGQSYRLFFTNGNLAYEVVG